MLHSWENDKKFHGVKIGRSAPSISHLMFADDVINFCKANLEEVRNVQNCLLLYYKWSGQAFNKEKSGFFFSQNVSGKVKALIKIYLGMKELDKKSKHLGMPLIVERNKSLAFENLRRTMENKFQGWKANLLSQTERATLVKHVATSFPVYTMSSFLLSKGWCESLEKLARDFFMEER